MTETVRLQVITDLASLVARARRCQYLTRQFAEDPLTEWDRRHADIDAVLDRLEPLRRVSNPA